MLKVRKIVGILPALSGFIFVSTFRSLTLALQLRCKLIKSVFLFLTGVLLHLTPGYVRSVSSFPVPSGLAGEIFCRLFGSRYLLFTVGKVSILNVTCLAIERWYCIFRPLTYKLHFTRKRLLLYILAIWVGACLLQIYKFFEWKLSAGKCSSVNAPYREQGTQAMIIISTLVSFYIPCFIAWATFAHIALLFKTSLIARCYGERQRAQQKALLRMCGVTSLVLTLCWFPNQTIYILSPFHITKIGSELHMTGGIFAMFNSCVNPLIYWATNKEYRDELFELFKVANRKWSARNSYDLEYQLNY